MFLSRDPAFGFLVFTALLCLPSLTFPRLLARVSFFFEKRKAPKKFAPLQHAPKKALGASLSFQLCQRVGLTRNPARRPQFAVHGKLPLPKLKSEACCTGGGKSKTSI